MLRVLNDDSVAPGEGLDVYKRQAPIHAFGRVDISGKGIERQTPVVPCNGNDVLQHNHVAPHGIGAAFLLRAQKILEIRCV